MTRSTGILCLLILGAGIAVTAQSGLPDGYGQLVLKRSANDAVEDAAADLANLLARAYGISPVIRRERLFEFTRSIHIGTQPDHPQFDTDPLTDEILIERNSRGILITGSDNTATCFAVYRFLQHFLGWRYYQPGPLGLEQLDSPPEPPSPDGEYQILLHEKAAFYSRNLSGLTTPYGSLDWRQWNGLRERFKYSHAVHRIITPDLFDEHPDWFAKDENGQPRRPPYSTPHGYNDHPDLANPEVRDHIARHLMSGFPTPPGPTTPQKDPTLLPHPSSPVPSPTTPVPVSLSLGDSFIFGHFADDYPWKPKKYFRRWPDWSNHVFEFTNDLAARLVDQWHDIAWGYGGQPDLYLGALSYLTWESPPEFKVHPSIVPYLTYDRSQWYDAAARADDLVTIENWAKKGTKVLGTWDYLFGYGFLMPRSMTRIVAESIPAIHESGIRAYYSEVSPMWPYDVHTTWLMTRLLWDISVDVDALLDEFYREFYGPADMHMRSFFEIAERTWMNQGGSAFWLRHWKDPWQAALWNQKDLENMQFLLKDALNTTRAMREQRYYQRILQTADLFEATLLFVQYQNRMWELQTGNQQAAPAAVDLRKRLQDAVAEVVRRHPMAGSAKDVSWITRYDGIGGNLVETGAGPDLLDEWCRAEGFDGIPDTRKRESMLFDTAFNHADDPRVWYQSLMDSEGAVMTSLPGGGGFLANSVRRGHLYQPFTAVPGDFYLGSLDVDTAQSPSGEVYIRVDFFDANNRLVAESRRARIAPTERYGTRQTLRVLMQAPANAIKGRLFIRFFEMDPGSQAIVTHPDVQRLGRITGSSR